MKKITLLLMIITALQFASKAQSLLLAGLKSKDISLINYNNSKQLFAPVTNTSFTGKDMTPGYDNYIRKSKNCRTTGFILLGTGLASSLIGLAVATNSSSFEDDETAGVLFIVGGATGIASIPFMIMAHIYKHKAGISLDNKKTGAGIPFNSGSVTGLTLSMNIGK